MKSTTAPAATLRQRAEDTARERDVQPPESLSHEAAQALLQELRVHQIELEMQNEELRRTQAELEASRARFFDLYDLAPVGYVTVDETGLIQEANLTATTLLGVERTVLVNRPFSRFVAEPNADAYYLFVRRLFQTDDPQTCELRMTRNGAAPFWAHLVGTAVDDGNSGRACRIALSDVTERVQSEEVLRRIEEWHRSVLETAMDGFWRVDTQGRLMEVNAAYCRMSGYSQQELLAMDVSALEANESASETAAHIRQTMAQGEARFESRHRRRDGSFIDVEINAQFRPEDGGCIVTFLHDITQRKQVEALLHKSNEQFRTLAEVAPVGIYLCDPSGHCLYANPAWCAMAGLSLEEALGTGWMQGLHPEERSLVSDSWARMVESRGKWGCEYRFQNREGRVTWVYGLATPQCDATGSIIQYVGINLDITARKQADDVLAFLARTSSGTGTEPFFGALARYLAQSLNMDFVCIDRLEGDGLTASTVAVWCDGRFEDNVSYALKDTPCGDVVGKTVCCFPASVCQHFPRDQVLKDLRAESYVGVTLFDHTGRPIGLIAVIGRNPLTNRPQAEAVLKMVSERAADEIERLDAEETLRASERRYRTLFDRAKDGILILTVTGDVVSVNESYARIHGYEMHEMTQLNLKALSTPACFAQFADRMHRIASGESLTFEVEHYHRDGHTFPLEVSASMVESGGVAVIQTFSRDIAERRKVEAEIQNMAKLRSIGTLAGGIAHDFNNILLGLFGNISLAVDALPAETPARKFLDEAGKSMSRAILLTQRLLTFAKGGDPVTAPLCLGSLIEDVARFDLSGSTVRLQLRQTGGPWWIKADKGQLQQVVSNLVINARQAMPHGGDLWISMDNETVDATNLANLPAGHYVKVAVRDEGCGIDPKLVHRIFEPYFTTKQAGNGLGLATTYSIVAKHGGHIGVSSELGVGTTFTLLLPASSSAPAAEAPPPPPATPQPIRASRILVMDDEEMVRTLATSMLERSGYTVATAVDGRAAIAMYRQAMEDGTPFDAVIMDLTVPGGLGGLEAIQELLALDPQVRAIVSSGYSVDPAMAKPAAYGFVGAAAKPYTRKILSEVIERVLR